MEQEKKRIIRKKRIRRKIRIRRKKKRQRNLLIFLISVLIIIGVFIGKKFRPNNLEENLLITQSNQNKDGESNKDEYNSADEVENSNSSLKEQDSGDNKLNNSGYLSFEEDPNADDAAMVAENTNGLLNGTKSYPVRTDGKKVAYLTFDDGPSTTNTPQVLDVLDTYNIKAIFFVLGLSLDSSEESKEILKDIVNRGHAIGNHTYGHNYSYLYPNRVMNVDNILSDFEKNKNAMKEVLGNDFSTRVIRFPGGYWSWDGRTAMKEAVEQNGYYNVDWNALNKDAEGKMKNAYELVQCLKESVQALGPNADSVVILMHDTYGKEETIKALPEIIEYLQSESFEFKSIK